MAKDFKAYSDLWLTSNEWYMNYDKWQTGPWNELDADQVEKFVEERSRTLAQARRYFREKE